MLPPSTLVASSQQFMNAIAGGPVAAILAVDANGAPVGAPPTPVAATVTVQELTAGTWGDGGTARLLTASGGNAVSFLTSSQFGVLDMSNALVVGGSFGASLRLLVSFQWLTGEVFHLHSAPIVLVAPNVAWLQVPQSIRYGDSYDVEICVSAGTLTLESAELSCALSSGYVTGGSGVLPMAGTAVAAFGNTNRTCGRFEGVSWAPAQPTHFAAVPTVISITSSCAVRGQPLRDVSGRSHSVTAVVAQLRVHWRSLPPAVVFPTAADPVTTWGASAKVTIIDDAGISLPSHSRATCTIAVDDAGGFIHAADAAACSGVGKDISLCSRVVGTRVTTLEDGVATFDGVGIDAPFGSWAVLRVTCSRSVGGVVLPAFANVTVTPLIISWLEGVSAAVNTGVLYNTPMRVAIRVAHVAADGTGWIPVSAAACSIAVAGGTASMSDAAAPTSDTTGNGTATFLLAVVGAPGARGFLTATCIVAGRSIAGGIAIVTLDSSAIEWVTPLPSLWMPSTAVSGGRNPLPTAQVRLIRKSAFDGSVTRAVDAHMLRCHVSVLEGEGSILDGPPAGYVLDAATTVAITADGAVNVNAVEPPALSLTSIMVTRSSCGGAVRLGISCTRRQGDRVPVLVTEVRFPAPALRWLEQPPQTVSPQQAFSATVVLVDSEGATERIHLDNSTRCTLQLTGTVDDSEILLGSSESAPATGGIIRWTGASVSARAGLALGGTAWCQFPGLPAVNGSLPWALHMVPCGEGTIAVGFTCQVCGKGTWSPGGANATACVACPSVGTTCSAGRVLFAPGYFRTDGSSLMAARDTVDAATEIIACLNPDACMVNASAASVAGDATHFCAPGYQGPLCSVCQTAGGPHGSGFTPAGAFACVPCADKWMNGVLVVLVTAAQLALIVWIAVFRTPSQDREVRGLFKVVITYVQTLGILFSFGARATESFRTLFSFSLAISASPLALPPVACALRAPYYAKWAAVVSLPVIVGAVAVVCGYFARSASGRRAAARLVAARHAVQHRLSAASARLAGRDAVDPVFAPAGHTSSTTVDPVSSCIFVITLYLVRAAAATTATGVHRDKRDQFLRWSCFGLLANPCAAEHHYVVLQSSQLPSIPYRRRSIPR